MRFAFGDNWLAFLDQVDRDRFEQAAASLRRLLQTDSLAGKRFVDIGSGSGLFSLAALSMGASVTSIDVDPASVQCTRRLKSNAAEFLGTGAGELPWTILPMSVLDETAMAGLGEFDVVYSWGVLHHTGDMERAITIAADRVAPGGTLAIAIYNDQGGASRRWLAVKTAYHRLPTALRPAWVLLIASFHECKFALARLAAGRSPLPFTDWKAKKTDRGMSVWHDWVDWVGGLPFEVAKPETIHTPLRRRGFVLENLTTVGSGWGCNEYVFSRADTTTA